MDNTSFVNEKTYKTFPKKPVYTLEYLPPYSPDFNPIEHKWAKAKSIRRKYNRKIEVLFRKCLE